MSTPGRASEFALVARDVSLTYSTPSLFGGDPRIAQGLRGVTLAVRRGGILGLTGARRSGKSSLAHCLARWSWPTSGDIERFTDVQLVPQYGPLPFNLRFNGPDQIEELPPAGLPVRREAVQSALDAVELAPSDMQRYEPDAQIRLSIAKALATFDTKPGTLILDDVLARCPHGHQLSLLSLLRKLQARQDLTVVVISQNLTLLRGMADEVCLMEHGRVAGFVAHRDTSRTTKDSKVNW